MTRSPVQRSLSRLALLAATMVTALAAAGDKQAGQVKARHEAGQTLLTFTEVDPPVTEDSIPARELQNLRRKLKEDGAIRYRIYRSESSIKSVEGLEPIAELPPLTCWNVDYFGSIRPEHMALRYVVQDGKEPVPPGTGICAYNPSKAGRAYYAVMAVIDGKQDTQVGPGNSLAAPIEESVGQGVPILQRTVKPERFSYVENPTLHYYVRWESPPNCSVQGKPIDYLVGIPPELAKPAPVGLHLHCWGGSLNGGYGWWYQAEQGHILIASNQVPYDWWTGYHERYWDGNPDQQEWEQGVVHPYSQRRTLSFLEWAATQWDVDLTRTHVAGNSMGGSGAPMFAIRHSDRIAWATGWVGVHIPAKTPRFKNSYANVYGQPEWNVKFEDGTPVWDYFDDTWYLKQHPKKEIGLICFSNGKNDGGIGWEQAVEFYQALQETRRPHIFVWGQSGHGQRARLPVSLSDRHMPMDLRTDQSQPAFTGCSLDDDPGNDDPNHGDAEGQSNLYLVWETDNVVDTKDSWQMTVGLVEKATENVCTASITPRRVQQFKPAPGTQVKWTNTSADTGEVIQTGESVVDDLGLITLPEVRIQKGKNGIAIGL